jgi:predicted TIM-barrel fold metal-dependent hydrolase
MNRLGIDRAVVVGGELVDPLRLQEPGSGRQVVFDNLAFLELCGIAPERLLPFFFANPWIEPDEYAAHGPLFYGLKFGPAIHGCPFGSRQVRSYLKLAARMRHPVYLHCLDQAGFAVSDFCELAGEFPNLTFILGHGGIGNIDFTAVAKINPFANVLYESSGPFKAVVAKAIETLGVHRVLFGTEHPLQSAAAELAKIKDLGLDGDAYAAITGGNILKLLNERPKEVPRCNSRH